MGRAVDSRPKVLGLHCHQAVLFLKSAGRDHGDVVSAGEEIGRLVVDGGQSDGVETGGGVIVNCEW